MCGNIQIQKGVERQMHPKRVGRPKGVKRKRQPKTIRYIKGEVWKMIPNTECAVSNLGRVKWRKPYKSYGRVAYRETLIYPEKDKTKNGKYKEFLRVKLKYPKGLVKDKNTKYPRMEYVHILVAQAFNPKRREGETRIVHRDGDIYNNYGGSKEYNFYDGNLEWMTDYEYKVLTKDNRIIEEYLRRPARNLKDTRNDEHRFSYIICISLKTGESHIFKNQTHAAVLLDLNRELINSSLNGNREHCKDYVFAYLDEIKFLPILSDLLNINSERLKNRLRKKAMSELKWLTGE